MLLTRQTTATQMTDKKPKKNLRTFVNSFSNVFVVVVFVLIEYGIFLNQEKQIAIFRPFSFLGSWYF